MNKLVSIALLAAGVSMLIFGMNASDSVSSGVSRFFNGTPTDKTIWLLVGGALLALVGAGGLFRGSNKS